MVDLTELLELRRKVSEAHLEARRMETEALDDLRKALQADGLRVQLTIGGKHLIVGFESVPSGSAVHPR